MLTGLTVSIAVGMYAVPIIKNGQGSIDDYSKMAGLAIALLGAVPVAKMIAINKNIDRIRMLRNKWRRLKEMSGDTKEELSKIVELVWAACK